MPSPHNDISVSISTEAISGQAEGGDDYVHQSQFLVVSPSDFRSDGTEFTARKEVTLVIVDDALDEPDETLTVEMERSPGLPEVVALRQPDGTACPARRCAVTVTIVDNDDPAPNFYLWTTTMTVGVDGIYSGYESSTSRGSISTGASFNYPPFSPPPKHNFDSDHDYTMVGLYVTDNEDVTMKSLTLKINDADVIENAADSGNLTLWVHNTAF